VSQAVIADAPGTFLSVSGTNVILVNGTNVFYLKH